ncbi:MAG: hypothetical protein J6S67_07375 [Methanobrevibacter sp.]|nr:hypothetical protein [Methanobrevibacter sp.]
MANIFEAIRSQQIPFMAIILTYHVPQRNGFCLCPFHNDSHPSMKIYKDHGYCFACHKYTDGIGLVAQRCGLTPLAAAERIACDFNIQYDEKKPLSSKEWNARVTLDEQKKLEGEKKMGAKINAMYDSLKRMWTHLDEWEKKYGPKNKWQMNHPNPRRDDPRYDVAVHNVHWIWDLIHRKDCARTLEERREWLDDICCNENIYELGNKMKELIAAAEEKEKKKAERKEKWKHVFNLSAVFKKHKKTI